MPQLYIGYLPRENIFQYGPTLTVNNLFIFFSVRFAMRTLNQYKIPVMRTSLRPVGFVT